ncbi:MAG: hypothetical protein M1827_006127 [Pycnora praestabilis]|nr:MAG: hypothetical protein M1827_006127 [Pycnora praestabilis]
MSSSPPPPSPPAKSQDPCATHTSGTLPATSRKRRRRAPATGAAEDCFACRKRHAKCDRRRPYCTQCLDQGKDCSGYRQTLTWGVGVASRGKLRGLSLPIVQDLASKAVAQGTRSRVSKGVTKEPTVLSKALTEDHDDRTQRVAQPATPMRNTTYDFVKMDPPLPAVPIMPVSELGWKLSNAKKEEDDRSELFERRHREDFLRPSLKRLHTHVAGSRDDVGILTSAGAMNGFSENEYPSPLGFPQTPDDFSMMHTAIPTPMYNFFQPHQVIPSSPENSLFTDRQASTSCPEAYFSHGSMSSSLSSDQSIFDFVEGNNLSVDPMGPCTLSEMFFDDGMLSSTPESHPFDHGYNGGIAATNLPPRSSPDRMLLPIALATGSSPSSSTIPPSIHSGIAGNPRMPLLMEYYVEVICPFIVALDGPGNPYRNHILQLAVTSESLQNAIAALAASNMRMKRHHNTLSPEWCTRGQFADDRSSVSLGPNRDSGPPGPLAGGSQYKEEHFYKETSIRLLNAQLLDPSQAKSDSVLATLLILCLYHICETGVAQFKTQFAGVKKLLGMRTKGTATKNWNWMATMFTWFDAMAATVNDREAQFPRAYLDTVAMADDDGALENLTGCDARLFKIIAKLGRLNLLSQNRQVIDPAEDFPKSIKPQPSRLAGQAARDYYSMNFDKFDGNGWATMIDDDDLMRDEEESRTHFWKLWKDVRMKLQEWEFGSSSIAPMCSATLHVSPEQRGFLNISESFRYAALLYTERLAYPHLPSSHLNFQNLVAQALYHLTSVPPHVQQYLLWPLFIVGTECVSDHHQSIIRERCLDLQKESGFYNNISALHVLEEVWNTHAQSPAAMVHIKGEEENNSSSSSSRFGNPHTPHLHSERSSFSSTSSSAASNIGQGFRWRKAMDRIDGEYIVL